MVSFDITYCDQKLTATHLQGCAYSIVNIIIYIQWDGAFVLGFSHCLYFRIRDFSWWDLELPTKEEMQNGINNLEKVNYKVDYIISHCCPTSIQTLLNPSNKKDILTDYLQEISEKCEFKKWYFGHYHDYRQFNSQYILLYEDIVPLKFESILK